MTKSKPRYMPKDKNKDKVDQSIEEYHIESLGRRHAEVQAIYFQATGLWARRRWWKEMRELEQQLEYYKGELRKKKRK